MSFVFFVSTSSSRSLLLLSLAIQQFIPFPVQPAVGENKSRKLFVVKSRIESRRLPSFPPFLHFLASPHSNLAETAYDAYRDCYGRPCAPLPPPLAVVMLISFSSILAPVRLSLAPLDLAFLLHPTSHSSARSKSQPRCPPLPPPPRNPPNHLRPRFRRAHTVVPPLPQPRPDRAPRTMEARSSFRSVGARQVHLDDEAIPVNPPLRAYSRAEGDLDPHPRTSPTVRDVLLAGG